MKGLEVIRISQFKDSRGILFFLDDANDIPFKIKRIYFFNSEKSGHERGFHAHKNLKQAIFCPSGECSIYVDNGRNQLSVKLDSPNKILILSGLFWREIKDFSDNTTLICLANDYYDEGDYIRDFNEFKKYALNNDDTLS